MGRWQIDVDGLLFAAAILAVVALVVTFVWKVLNAQ